MYNTSYMDNMHIIIIVMSDVIQNNVTIIMLTLFPTSMQVPLIYVPGITNMEGDYLHTASNQILKWEWPGSKTNHDCATSGMCDIVGRA